MGLKSYRPSHPRCVTSNWAIRRILRPIRRTSPLLKGIKRSSGRNNNGRITSRRRGGGHKRVYRVIDFSVPRTGIACTVETIEYDPKPFGPHRSVEVYRRSASVHYRTGYPEGRRRPEFPASALNSASAMLCRSATFR